MTDLTGSVQFEIDPDSCVACLSCVRACPVQAIAVDDESVQIVDEACIRCGACVPACPHDSVDVLGDMGRAMELAASDEAVLLLSVEAEVFFHPQKPEQLVNAAYSAGFKTVYRGILGDELVATEYQRLWNEGGWTTMIRSTCPIVVQRIRNEYPDLVPYLAPVRTPVAAEVAYIREKHGRDVKIVYAGVCIGESNGIDATITFSELDQLFRARGVDIASQPLYFTNLPQERRRHVSLPGGLPLSVLADEPQTSRRFKKIRRDLTQLETINRAVAEDGLMLGFVDILPCEGCLDHPLMGSREELFYRRSLLDRVEPRRSPEPVVDPDVEVDITTTFSPARNLHLIDEAEAEAVIERIGYAADGKQWDCGACGYSTCRKFASAFIKGRATYRQCPPYQERTAKQAQEDAAIDVLTGLSTFRVLQQRLHDEVARSGRTGDSFGILFADLDRFKLINDRYGHESGNRVIKMVADIIRAAVRRSDIAARYGGDEFVVVLIGTELGGAMRVAEQVRRAVEEGGVRAGYAAGAVSVSIGVVSHRPGPRDEPVPDLLDMADRALYQAKSEGGNRVKRGDVNATHRREMPADPAPELSANPDSE